MSHGTAREMVFFACTVASSGFPPPFDRNLRPENEKNKTVLEEAFGQSDVPEAIGRN
jgi:hypothetical protein